MTSFLPRQGWYTALILGLFAPILLSIGLPQVRAWWGGLSFVWFVLALVVVFVALSWAFAGLAFAPTENAAPEVEGEQ